MLTDGSAKAAALGVRASACRAVADSLKAGHQTRFSKHALRRLQGRTGLCGWLLALAGALAICTLALWAQPVPFGRIKNFSVPEYYAPPNHNQVKSLISGTEAEPQPEGRFLIKELKAEMFRENGERGIVINAPECLYDSAKREASSAGRLQMQSGDGRLFIEGEGFLWRQDDSTLIISNRVHSVIQPRPSKHKMRRS